MPIKPGKRTDIPSMMRHRTQAEIEGELAQIERMGIEPISLTESEIATARQSISSETVSQVVNFASMLGFESIDSYIEEACATYNEMYMNG